MQLTSGRLETAGTLRVTISSTLMPFLLFSVLKISAISFITTLVYNEFIELPF